MSQSPTPQITSEAIVGLVGSTFAMRGLRYAEAGHVDSLQWVAGRRTAGSSYTLQARVSGTGPEPYATTIFLTREPADLDPSTPEPGTQEPVWDLIEGICSCPVGFDCKHVAAALFAAQSRRAGAWEEDIVPAEPTETPSGTTAEAAGFTPEQSGGSASLSWRKILGVAAAGGTAADGTVMTSGADPLAIGVELHRVERPFRFGPPRRSAATVKDIDDAAVELSVTIRPLVLGARGDWIRGGLTWKKFQYSSPSTAYRRDHAEVMGDICRTRLAQEISESFVADAMPLESFRGPGIFHLLHRAVRLGVRLVPQDVLSRIELTAVAELSLDVRAEPEGPGGTAEADSLSVRAQLTGVDNVIPGTLRQLGVGFVQLSPDAPDEPQNRFEASSPAEAEGTSTGVHLRLIPTDGTAPPDLLSLAATGVPLWIPGGEAAEFLHETVPALRQSVEMTSLDGSVEFPETPAAQLHLRVHHLGDDATAVEWGWRYFGPQRTLPVRTGQTRDGHAAERDHHHENQVLAAVSAHHPGAAAQPAQHLTGLDTALFVERALPRLEALEYVTVEERGTRPEYRELTESPQLRVTQTPAQDGRSNDWFDLGFQITVSGRVVPFKTVFEALSRGRQRILLPDKTHLRLDHPHLLELKELIDEAAAMGEWEPENLSISRYQVSFWDDLETLAQEVEEAETWRREVSRLKAALPESPEIPVPAVPDGLTAELRSYQVQGYAWLSFLYDLRLGGILADDMGLGKTVQTLAMILRARSCAAQAREQPGNPHDPISPAHDDAAPPFLVVAPSSVVTVWRDEAARFAPELDVRVLDTTAKKSGRSLVERIEGADVVVTSYAILRLDATAFTGCSWAGVVLDEAQFVKNRSSKAHQALKQVRAPFRLAITGTPMENSLTDLWSILDVVTPGLMPPLRGFRDEYVRPIETPDDSEDGARRAAHRMARLRRRIRPFMLRRSKDLVAADLPEKHEQVMRVPLQSTHRTLYEKVLQRERQKVLGLLEDMDKNRFIVFRSLTLLRMLALDPGIVDEGHRAPSSKLEALLPDLEEVVSEGHRVLIFSQFTSFLDRIAARLDELGVVHTRLDGATRRRDDAVARFREGEAPVFLISLKAGGFGLTLTEADYVFLLDPWWNPAAEAQAVDRAHRIGQDKPVMVYRMVAEGTIEERVLTLQQRKAELFSSLTDEDAAFSASVTADDIRELFRT
ncbi:DEAD/DEAH box helicase [Nesterenkonia aerolata]|uniref:DEAD/DEAH box helicase n=1 Tax=Nesterenkonia aerolata TaxID=3074079 RepID=A0ABU2DV00_9MICC|nr:DEAD/DEAH box helicase [Nesterenkonia sp. LY-0111]MDR8020304.1 DEAD/DEAH box helicase [Nesterenkonia sp. LY-0111]